MLLLLPLIAYRAAFLPVGSAGVHEWLPDGRVERERYEHFLQQFGSDQFLLISWEGCRVDDPRLPAFTTALKSEPDTRPAYLRSVQSTVDIVRSLTDEPLELDPRLAASRLKHIVLGQDGQCAVVAIATPYALKHQAKTIEHVHQAADQVEGLGRTALRMAGTVYEANAVDVAAEHALRQLALPSMLIGIVLACVCLRSALSAIAVLAIAGVGTLLAVVMVAITGGQFSAVLIVLPTLVFMLTLSSAVHLMHYYVEASLLHQDHLGSRALLMGFKPTLLSSITTSLGMASLVASQLSPVREFGLYSSLSLCVATAFLLCAFPALSDWFYCRKAQQLAARHKVTTQTPIHTAQDDEPTSMDAMVHQAEDIIAEDTHAPVISPLARRYTAWMNRHCNRVAMVGLFLIGLSMVGLMYLQPSTKFDDMFPEDSPTIRDMEWLEEHIGPIASVEVLLRFPADCSLDEYDRLEWVDRVTAAVRSHPQLGVAMSATSFLPDLPRGGGLRSVARRSVFRNRLSQARSSLEKDGWVARDEAGEAWRITVKVSATSGEDYGILTARVTNQVDEATRGEAGAVPFTTEITGLYPVMHSTQLSLIDDLQISFTAAFLLITPVMMLIARGFWAGLLIMVPNVLPETLVFGMMAWLGFRLDIAGLLTASVAMGIAVNDTLHFVNWYARRLAAGDTRTEAIADTLSSCAGAMFHTMLISCCSMLPFLFADFLPTRQFAFLMIAMLSSAILGDLVLLPGMLLSPLGLCLLPKRTMPTTAAPTTAAKESA